jgi:hypothetical protein
MRRSTRVLAVLTASLSLIGLQVQLAQADRFDTTPPTLTFGKPAFVVGNVLAASPDPTDDYYPFTGGIAQQLTWSATDNVGVSSYDLWVTGSGFEPGPILQFTQDTQYLTTADDYNGDFGCGSCLRTGYLVTARDSNFNATTRWSPMFPEVTQENNATIYGTGQITYTGSWSTGNCACFLQGHTARTSAANARATFTRTYDQGDHLAFVMAEGPGRGRATIRVDGVFIAMIDTFATTNTNRIVVFTRTMPAGVHTVSITNLATAGRARIDLDAVLAN